MRGVWIDPSGLLENLRCVEMPQPALTRDDMVLVEIYAAGINHSDIAQARSHRPIQGTLPVPGRDFAGVIVAGPEQLIGVEVWGSGGDLGTLRNGTHADYIALPLNAVQPKPETLSMEDAASMGVAYVAAWMALMEVACLHRDDTVLVTGGSGAVGGAVVNLARWHGARVMTTLRQPVQHRLVERNRPSAIIDLSSELLTAGALRRTEGRGVDVVIDTVGGDLFEPALESLARQGRMVCLSTPAERRVAFDLQAFYQKELRLYGINTLLRDAIACTRILTPLIPHFVRGTLLPPLVVAYPLEQVALAYQHMHMRQHWQKVVLKMRP